MLLFILNKLKQTTMKTEKETKTPKFKETEKNIKRLERKYKDKLNKKKIDKWLSDL